MTADVEAVVDLWVASWNATMPDIDFSGRGSWLRERLAEHEASGIAILCAVDDVDLPLGFVTVDPGSGHIDQLAVSLGRFGSGIGTALIAAARQVSPGELLLEVNQENFRAVGFYKRHGFVVTGEGTIGINRRKTWFMRCPARMGSGPV